MHCHWARVLKFTRSTGHWWTATDENYWQKCVCATVKVPLKTPFEISNKATYTMIGHLYNDRRCRLSNSGLRCQVYAHNRLFHFLANKYHSLMIVNVQAWLMPLRRPSSLNLLARVIMLTSKLRQSNGAPTSIMVFHSNCQTPQHPLRLLSPTL